MLKKFELISGKDWTRRRKSNREGVNGLSFHVTRLKTKGERKPTFIRIHWTMITQNSASQ
jgi:hypothetical protein